MSRSGSAAIQVLRWTLGIVILIEAAQFAFSHSSAVAFAKTGLPNFIRLGVAWAEIVAAALFLVPGLVKVGGRALIAVLTIAIVVHLLHGWFNVGSLVIYVAAVWAVMEAG